MDFSNGIILICIFFEPQIDIWKLADQHMHITGKNGKKYTLSTACDDIIAHEKLTDEVIKFNDPNFFRKSVMSDWIKKYFIKEISIFIGGIQRCRTIIAAIMYQPIKTVFCDCRLVE